MHYLGRYYLRHGLKDGFDAVSHGELVNQLLRRLVIVHLPAVVALNLWQFDASSVHLFRQVVEEVLVQTRVLDVVGGHLDDNGILISLGFKRKDDHETKD